MSFRNGSLLILGALCLSACSSGEPAGSNTVDEISPPGVTQPSPPEPGTVSANNPRDPRSRPPRINADPAGTPEATEPRPAPENSDASVMMNSDGSITEFRNFRSHPRLKKVEANWFAPSEKRLKIFLMDGKIVETVTDRVPQLHNVETRVLLELVDAARAKGKK